MEQLAVPAQVMRRRVEEVLDLLGIAALRSRPLRTLSGGEQQRVAIGAVLTPTPRALVLDEPTSALDPVAAEDTLSVVLRLVHDLGVTVVAAEHRLERVLEYADRLVVVDRGHVSDGKPSEMIEVAPLAPPVAQLGRLAGWRPLPLSVRDARRLAGDLRASLTGTPSPRAVAAGDVRDGLTARALTVAYGPTVAVRDVDLDLRPGEVVALMGRNGSGKSSLLEALQGALRRGRGSVLVAGSDTASIDRSRAARLIALVPQQASDLLFCDSVDAECSVADRAGNLPAGSTRAVLDELLGDEVLPSTAHPRDVSDGQQLALVLAIQLVSRPRVLLLDEPTRGLDYDAKDRLSRQLTDLARSGLAVMVATHDVEFAALTATRVVVLADGEVITDAASSAALTASPVFAPQVAKILAPVPLLTVGDVAAAVQHVAAGAERP
jgi:energy-coupling factor transport system ATP-binding protein